MTWDHISVLCVNDSYILLTAGADTITMMALWLVYKLSYL